MGKQFQAAADMLAGVMTKAADCVETGAPYEEALGELHCCGRRRRSIHKHAHAGALQLKAAPVCAVPSRYWRLPACLTAAAALRKMETHWRQLPKLCPELNSRCAAATALNCHHLAALQCCLQGLCTASFCTTCRLQIPSGPTLIAAQLGRERDAHL